MYIRDEWIKRTEFHADSNVAVLKQVLARAQDAKSRNVVPVVIFDLDSTLFDVTKRSYEILREWLAHPETQSYTETQEKLKNLNANEMKYSLEDVWNARAIAHEEEPFSKHYKHAKSYWRKRFFSHVYLPHDQPTEGALVFVKKLYDLGVSIVYLTGRDVPLMGFGTYDQLKEHGFPIEQARTRLILKPKRHIDDLVFKKAAAQTISELGEVIASFENEPKNLMAMGEVFDPKQTMNVFIHTVSSDHPSQAGKGIYKIKNFKI